MTRYLTIQFARHYQSAAPCETEEADDHYAGFPGYCDMGPDRTVVQHDSDRLIRIPHTKSLPCRFFTREGRRITSLEDFIQVSDNSFELDLYAVPAGRMFMFAPAAVGDLFELRHVRDTTGRPLVVHTLSLQPRVFDIYHFFSHEESNALMEKALKETSETHRFHRSTTGTTGKSVFNKRTSENAWDTNGVVATKIKK